MIWLCMEVGLEWPEMGERGGRRTYVSSLRGLLSRSLRLD